MLRDIYGVYYEINKKWLREDNEFTSSFFVLEQEQRSIRFVMLYNENIFDVRVDALDLSKSKYSYQIETVPSQFDNFVYNVFEIVRDLIKKSFTGIIVKACEINVLDDEDIKFPIYVDDESIPLEVVLAGCSEHVISLGFKNIEDSLYKKHEDFGGDDIEYDDYYTVSVCGICSNVHLSERLHILEDDGCKFCDDCIDTKRVVECSCVHHKNKGYFMRIEEAEYEDEGSFYCEAYDNDSRIWFDNYDEEEDYYEDMIEY